MRGSVRETEKGVRNMCTVLCSLRAALIYWQRKRYLQRSFVLCPLPGIIALGSALRPSLQFTNMCSYIHHSNRHVFPPLQQILNTIRKQRDVNLMHACNVNILIPQVLHTLEEKFYVPFSANMLFFSLFNMKMNISKVGNHT